MECYHQLKMAKILILTSKLTDTKKSFVNLVKQNFQDEQTEISIEEISTICLSLSKNEISFKVSGVDICRYDLVFLRGITSRNIFIATTVAMVLEKLGIKYFDTLYSEAGPHRSKLGSLVKLVGSTICIPKTLYFADKNYTKHYREISCGLGSPFVAKEMSLQKGKGVHRIYCLKDLRTLPAQTKRGSENEYFFQKFIEKDHEYRILVLGKKIGVWEEKISASKDEFRNNIALGAREIFLNVKDIPSKLETLAINAADSLGIQVAGVDVIVDVHGKYFVLEVNRGPGLTYDESVSPEFKAIAEFLEKECRK